MLYYIVAMATVFVVSYNFLHKAFRSTPCPLCPPSSSSSSSYALPSSSSTMLVASSAFERRLVVGLGQKTTTAARQLRSCCYNSRWVNLLSSRGMCNGVLASAGGPSPTHSSSGAEKSKSGDSVLLPVIFFSYLFCCFDFVGSV
ncbi:hypothetical protein O6H91_03G115600 [Diphasiastrum complanatum]|uniref:Uncharacterized protein n=1 Tax=Diphasiastrum complanatum TaxID=34168 RepID=A0ACC2EB47_DIPCM|nr:hypothetical protein O6H91_03G115600 [Diphasiastrum complanatum]